MYALNVRQRLMLCLFIIGLSATAGTRVTNFGSNPGNLDMYRYVPAQLQSSAPLVVLLHGCTQNANAFETETGWADLADRWGFALVSAEQKNGNNSSGCFNWFEGGDISRGLGEAQSIISMVNKMKSDYTIDNSRVYVVGFSAGGAMTTVMLATYPDVFAGGGVLAGVPYNCDTGLTGAFSCMSPGKNLSPSQWASRVFNASNHSGPWPKVSIWHGDADYTVSVANATEIMEQWTQVHGIDQTPDVEDTIKGNPHKIYRDSNGNDLVETYTIPGMGHTVPIDPGTGEDQGGSTGSYAQDRDIWASYYMARFFGLDDTDSEAPTVSITAPSDGATVSGSVSVTATASDNVGVTGVSFYIDGQLVSTDTSSPYSYTWNTANEANGAHSILAKASDAAGNEGCSDTFEVTVTGGLEDVTPPTVTLTFPTNGATVHGTVNFTASASDDFSVASVEFFVDSISVGTGTPSGQVGPWSLAYNTTSLTDGTHTVSVKAYDAAGNEGSDGPVSIEVDQNVLALDETFSDLDANGDTLSADTAGWQVSGFSASSDNHTLGTGGSGSILGQVSSGAGCSGGAKYSSASIDVTLGDNPQLSYFRKLDLQARVNLSTSAHFRVYADNMVVDEETVTYDTYTESSWTERNLDLSAFADSTVTLKFEVMANSNICLTVDASAWIDDITIGNPTSDEDTTAPTVNLTAPSNGATLTGSVDLTASASDNVGVAKVEFFADGQLLGVDTDAPYSYTWDTTSTPDGTVSLMARAYDAAGNMSSDNDTSVTVDNSGSGGGGGGGTTPTTVTFNNVDSQDGYVKANASGGSGATGTFESFYGLAIGRGSDGKFNRTILSFDTSSLPNDAVITDAYIEVVRNSSSGDAWSNSNELLIDVNTGCYGGCSIATSDWSAASDVEATAELLKWTSGSQSSTSFNAAGMGAINLTGTTQMKLRFSQNQTSTAYVFIDNGSSAKLVITYQ